METGRAELNTSLSFVNIDYGYEEHNPAPRSEFDGEGVCRRCSVTPLDTIDATEISQSPSHHECSTVTFDLKEEDYPPMPADRQARKQRSFSRRGGAVHSTLLKSAVLASMMEYDSSDDGGHRVQNYRRGSCQSSISLQSLQEALRTETMSPRKRARRGRPNMKSKDSAATMDSDDDDENDGINEASNMFDTLRMSSSNSNGQVSVSARKEPARREPPARRVSRKTSHDSRVSGFDSEISDWED